MNQYKQFKEFHFANPRVFALFAQYTLQMYDAGRAHYSIGAVCERVRWHVDIETTSSDSFKINNNHRAYYARLIMLAYPRFQGFFQLREQIHPVDDVRLLEECFEDWRSKLTVRSVRERRAREKRNGQDRPTSHPI